MSYSAPYSANVHGMSHAVMAEAIAKTHRHMIDALGKENALTILDALLTRIVDEKLVENQYDGASDFLDEVANQFDLVSDEMHVIAKVRATLID